MMNYSFLYKKNLLICFHRFVVWAEGTSTVHENKQEDIHDKVGALPLLFYQKKDIHDKT